jgi:hypothetical protein
MPDFIIRVTTTQVLSNSRDYRVTADTVEEAGLKLCASQTKSDSTFSWVGNTDIVRSDFGNVTNNRYRGTTTLEARDVISGGTTYALLDADGKVSNELQFDYGSDCESTALDSMFDPNKCYLKAVESK